MGGFLGDKALDLFKEAMEDYGIEPGELYEAIDDTLEVINELAPAVERMESISEDLEKDVSDFKEEIGTFNENSEEMVDAMNNLSTSLEKFADIMDDMQEEEE